MEKMPKIPGSEPLHQAVGEAIAAYAEVEMSLASLLQTILKIDTRKAFATFFAIQNIRSRCELFQTLLTLQYDEDIRKYWASCTKFLLALALFRNAIAHWHPYVSVYEHKTTKELKFNPALGHPVPGSSYPTLQVENFPPFLRDCRAIREELTALILLMKELPSPLPEKFRQPITHRNQAALQSRRKPKEQKARPRSSRPSVPPRQSSAQRRQRAISALKKAKKES